MVKGNKILIIVRQLMSDTAAVQSEFVSGRIGEDEMKTRLVRIAAQAVVDILDATDD